MADFILTQPSPFGGVSNTFETIITDTGIVTAQDADTLIVSGGVAINVSASSSPKTLTIDVDPSEINLNDLGDVSADAPGDGYTLVYRSGSPVGWVAEPSTTTDEFVKVSGTDTTTGHLTDKLSAGLGISFTTLTPGGDEQLEISLNAGLDDLNDVTANSPAVGDILIYTGSPATWVNVPLSSFDQNLWSTISADSGSTTADTPTDTLSIVGGSGIGTSISGDTLTIDIDPSQINLGDLGDVALGSPITIGYVLTYNGTVWEPTDPSSFTNILAGPGINVATDGSPPSTTVSLDICSLPTSGSPPTLDINDTIAVCDGTDTFQYTLQQLSDVLEISSTAWTTVNGDVGSIVADTPNDTLNVIGGVGIDTTASEDPDTLTIDLNAKIQDLSNVSGLGSPEIIPQYSILAAQTSDTLTPIVANSAGTEDQVLLFNNTTNQVEWELVSNLPSNLETVFNVWTDTGEVTGHVNRIDSTISFNSGTRTFTIQPSGAAPGSPQYYRYYIHGVAHDITTSKSVTIPNTTGLYYFYLDQNEDLQFTASFTPALLLDFAFTAVLYWNASPATGTPGLVYYGEERHGITMDGQTHIHFHVSFGTQYISGFALSNLNPDTGTPTDTDVQFSVGNGEIRDEDLEHFIRDESTSANAVYDLVQDLTPTAQIPVLFRDGGGSDWNIKPADDFPFIYSDGLVFTGASGLPPYNAESGGVWSLAEVANNSFFLVHYLATNDINNPIVAVQGITNFNNKPAGREQAEVELTQLSGLPFAEFTPIATVICEARTAYSNTPQIRFRTTDTGDDYIDWRQVDTLVTGGGPSDHGSLGGLSDDDHPQYTTDAYDAITDGTSTLTASGRDNTIKFEGSSGIDVNVNSSGSPAIDTVTITNTAPFPSTLSLSTINGQPVLTYLDSTRGIGSPPAGKQLSVAEQALTFTENQLGDNDWLEIGNAVDADSGYIVDFDGTVVFATGHCENTGANSKDIHLFVNGVDAGSIGTLTGGSDVQFINNTLDVDFAQGDKLRLQAQGAGGVIQDTVVKLTVKWRG